MDNVASAVILEVRRKGRRPRYHRGAVIGQGLTARPEQCNLDQAAGAVTQLGRLPLIRRPLTQLCWRCFAGHPLLVDAQQRAALP